MPTNRMRFPHHGRMMEGQAPASDRLDRGRPAITTEERTAGGVQSVERALSLLESLADLGQEVGVSDLRSATGLPFGTIHRLLGTLVLHGYARQNPETHKYTLGPRLLRLGDAAGRHFAVWARPFLTELMELSGESANLAMLEGDHAVYIAQVPSRTHHVRMFAEVGRRVLPHSTAVGKVLLAFRPRPAVEALLDRTGLPPRTSRTIVDRDRLLAELEVVARQGYAIDDGEEETGVRCVAVPVFGVGDSVAALSVSAPEGRLPRESYERLVPEMLRLSAAMAGSFVSAP
jgi:IclR family acetate operon transcriptional repressor